MSMREKIRSKASEVSLPEQALTGALRHRLNQPEDFKGPPIVNQALHSLGQPLDPGTRASMESSFGHDFSNVRIHTGAKAAESARSLNALAYTIGSHIVFGGRDQYALQTSRGQQLLAHELTHVVQQTGDSTSYIPESMHKNQNHLLEQEAETASKEIARGNIFRPKQRGSRQLARRDDLWVPGMDWTPPANTKGSGTGSTSTGSALHFITMKRKDIALKGDDKYGHWWTEMDNESYGWWPKYPLGGGVGGLWDTLTGVDGELNGITSFGGTATRDPHHGDPAPEEFHPILIRPKAVSQVKSEIRSFAKSYKGEWRWTLGGGQNCQTFQKKLMNDVGLKKP